MPQRCEQGPQVPGVRCANSVDACTIIARNYLAHARVLAESFFAHHPDGSFTVLVIDDPEHVPRTGEQFAVLTPYDLGLDRAEVHRMAFIYDVKEFATALKPWLLRRLLGDHEAVAYFDPDIQVFSPLDDISALAGERGIVLTPHVTEPLPRDGLLPDDEMLLRAGIYNLGFVAVGRKSAPFLDWWAERLTRDCIVAVDQGIFVDQRWIDFVPTLFEHEVLRDPACNVAYWNVAQRGLTFDGERYEVHGKPLRFYHFSGFSPDSMHLLSAHMGSVPRILLDEHGDVRRLCDEYARRLRAHGYARDEETYRFDTLPGGLAIDAAARREVREAIIVAERAGAATAPDPFDPASVHSFLDWLAEPGDARALPRYLDALYRRRGDLQATFPEVAYCDHRRFLEWAHTRRRDRPGVPEAVLSRISAGSPLRSTRSSAASLDAALLGLDRRHAALAPISRTYRRLRSAAARTARTVGAPDPEPPLILVPATPPLPGVNVAGYLTAELGVGEAARRLVQGLQAGGIPHATITYGRTASRQEHPFVHRRAIASYDTNVICVNADQLPHFRAEAGPALFRQRRTIGLWFWEVSRFPRELHRSFDLVDEVWVGSDFVRDALAPHTDKPVHVVPLPVEPPRATTLTRRDVGLPDDYVFLFSFDFLSVVERKNPAAVVRAFTQAFEPNEGPVLVIKTINGTARPQALAELRAAVADRPDIRVVDGYVSSRQRDALVSHCDCYVSLHRSEGYGLTMAEAMAAAKPVIATGYSGNLAFMDSDNSLLVPYRMTTIAAGCEPYPVGAEWAEPDVGVAASLMRDVWARPEEAQMLGRRAQEDVFRHNSPRRTAEFVAARLDDTRLERRRRAGDLSGAPMPGAALAGVGGRPTRIVRRLLQRLLWPYLVERHAFDMAIADALRAQETPRLRTDADRVERHVLGSTHHARQSDLGARELHPQSGSRSLGVDTVAVRPPEH